MTMVVLRESEKEKEKEKEREREEERGWSKTKFTYQINKINLQKKKQKQIKITSFCWDSLFFFNKKETQIESLANLAWWFLILCWFIFICNFTTWLLCYFSLLASLLHFLHKIIWLKKAKQSKVKKCINYVKSSLLYTHAFTSFLKIYANINLLW